MRCPPDLARALGLDVRDELLERDDARAMSGDVRMHREHEDGAFLVRLVELVHPHAGDVARIHVALAPRIEKRGVVEDPLHRNLDDAGGLRVLEQLVRPVVGHERALVAEPHVAQDRHRVGAEVPARRAIAGGLHAGHLRQLGHRLLQERALGGIR